MNERQRERLGELFEGILELPPDRRAARLEATCGDDPELRAELSSLLAAHEAAPEDLEEMADRILSPALSALVSEGAGKADEDGMIGRVVGHYEIQEKLGGGGMGVVYRAVDRTLDRQVALKFLPAHLSGEAARERLRTEARAASALDHPNIAVVHEIGETEATGEPSGTPRLYIVMGYYVGETLERKIARGPLSVAEALDYADQLAAGIERAHEAGIVHRDIKPANVIVTTRGRVKIVDFGVAKLLGADLTKEGATPGTVAYMSPEQTRGESVDARTDLWSLGVVLYQMLTGERPFKGANDGTLIHAIRHEIPVALRATRPDVPAALAQIVETCLEKDTALRHPNATSLRSDLASVAAGDGGRAAVGGEVDHARAGAARVRPKRWIPRVSLTVGIMIGLLLTGTAVVVLLRETGAGDAGRTEGVLDRSVVAVLPFAPSLPDSALARLGRDLVISLSATLDGTGDTRTADALTVLAQAAGSDGPLPLDTARGLARRLGAGRFLHGGLTRVGDEVRLDAALYGVADAEPVARSSTTADPDDVTALTDSVTLSLLRQLWEEDPPVAPSLDAITTRSVPALRAYLEGEQALVRYDLRSAVEAFERAFAADSTFWYAYWRSLYPRVFREGSTAVDTAILRRIRDHAKTFPIRDRLLVESWAEPSLSGKLALLRALTDRFDHYAPGWYAYANLLVHHGPYLGTTIENSRRAMEKAVGLNPTFAVAWDHLLWITLSQGDSVAAGRALTELERTIDATDAQAEWARIERFRYETLRSGLPAPDSLARVFDWLLSIPAPFVSLLASGFTADNLPAEQLMYNDALLERAPGDESAAAVWRGNALALVARGSWDSALVAADRWARLPSVEPNGAVRAYGIAVAGAALGALPVEEAIKRRPSAPLTSTRSADDEAELAWLDGVLAYVRADRAAIARAIDVLDRSEATDANVLRESLVALFADSAGDRERAVRLLADRERRTAEAMLHLRLRTAHPLLIPMNRLLGVRWLRSLDRDPEAGELLTWQDAIGGPVDQAWNRALGTIGLLDRAEIAEAGGRADQARAYYAHFLRRFDRPVPALRPLLRRAQAGLARVGGASE